MVESEITTSLLGPMGGIFGMGIGVGFTLGWTLCQKNIVAIHLERIEEINSRLSGQDEECKAEISELKNRISSLEDERVNFLKGITKNT